MPEQILKFQLLNLTNKGFKIMYFEFHCSRFCHLEDKKQKFQKLFLSLYTLFFYIYPYKMISKNNTYIIIRLILFFRKKFCVCLSL